MRRLLAATITAATTIALTGCVTMNQQTRECTVTGKESVTVHDSNDRPVNQYRVYTNECGTLTVTDSLLIGRMTSADLYGQLREGTTYRMETGGYRNGFMSMFPNIITATPMEDNQ